MDGKNYIVYMYGANTSKKYPLERPLRNTSDIQEDYREINDDVFKNHMVR